MTAVLRKRGTRRRRVIAEDKVTIVGLDELVMRIETGDRWLDGLFDCGWVRDQDLECCMVCAEDFHPILRRRHHCRMCGNLICTDCSTTGRLVVNNRDEFDVLCCVQCCYGQVLYVTGEGEDGPDHYTNASPDGSIAMVHTGINASERLLKFVLECRRTVSCEILLQKHCSWAHICSSVIKHMGLPVKDIDSFMIVDEDGEIDTRNIGSSINFWQHVLKYRTFAGRSLLVVLGEGNAKSTLKYFDKRQNQTATNVANIESTPSKATATANISVSGISESIPDMSPSTRFVSFRS